MSIFSSFERTVEREFRRWTGKMFGPADSESLVILRRAVLDRIGAGLEQFRGLKNFPYTRIRIRFISADPARRDLLVTVFGQDRRLEHEIREGLSESGFPIPSRFAVEIEAAEDGSEPFEIHYERGQGTERAEAPASSRLIVIRGKANQDSFTLGSGRTNIGRLKELVDSNRRVVRRNDIVFADGADEANASVSRGHAHIVFDPGEKIYRIFDDKSEYGTTVFRDGRSLVAPPGPPGERLQPGDEIYLGAVCIRFETAPSP
jgi:hypothetical protein